MTTYTGVGTDTPSYSQLTMTGPIYRAFAGPFTATPSGTQATGVVLNQSMTQIGTVATAGDAGLLPPALPGREHIVINGGANSANIFPAVGDQVNALSVNAAFALVAGKVVTFYCVVQGRWFTNLSA